MKSLYHFSVRAFLLSIGVLSFFFSKLIAQPSGNSTIAKSEWVYINPKGKLTYKTFEGGDKIMDFSYAGYMGGGVSIPSPSVKIILHPISGDNSDIIQKAIDQVSEMKMVNGFRGAVLLNPGTYDCEKTLTINSRLKEKNKRERFLLIQHLFYLRVFTTHMEEL